MENEKYAPVIGATLTGVIATREIDNQIDEMSLQFDNGKVLKIIPLWCNDGTAVLLSKVQEQVS